MSSERQTPVDVAARPSPFGPSTGYDPARELTPEQEKRKLIGKRIDLPIDAYLGNGKEDRFFPRKEYNTDKEAKNVKIGLNVFKVGTLPTENIYMYDVDVSPNPKDSKALVKKLWNHETVQKALKTSPQQAFLHDGNKLAWSSQPIPRGEMRLNVELARGRRSEIFKVTVRQTKVLKLQYLTAYLNKKVSWDETVLECMNFLDHLMRMYPSQTMVPIKRQFFHKDPITKPLATWLQCSKGTYAAFRLSDTIKAGGSGLMVNADVNTTAFWPPINFWTIAHRMHQCQDKQWFHNSEHKFEDLCRPVRQKGPSGNDMWSWSPAFTHLSRRMQKLKFVNNQETKGPQKIYSVKRFVFEQKYAGEGANSQNITFEKKLPDNKTEIITIYDHFQQKYNFRCKFPKAPLIETPKGEMFPMEVCQLIGHQRYLFKLGPEETAMMIRAAVTRPAQRKKDIMQGVDDLKWNQDPYLRAFKLEINNKFTVTPAKVLAPPNLQFANTQHSPGVSGRWDLRGKQFIECPKNGLKSWGIVSLDERYCNLQALQNFSRVFVQTYRGHGGKIDKTPYLSVMKYTSAGYGEIAERARNEIMKASGGVTPELIMFVLPDRNSQVYERLKKNMDCRYATPSQMMQAGHVKKAQAQYCSNICMKVNAKLGGFTSRVTHPNKSEIPPFFKAPTMIIGLDVSHAAPGSSQPSMAALTISTNKSATRYSASCQTNGWREEIIRSSNFQDMFRPHLRQWKREHGVSPQHVYFFRDGVSEGQFAHVIGHEETEIRRAFHLENFPIPKITVIVATKRHHIRFFPEGAAGDKNANPLPGTLVEHDATHPFHNDFYLCSHVAIQGTARPVHYHVIKDDSGVPTNILHKMIYHQCYQYVRSTTPVSLHPAVYYAHLASQRARAHEDISISSKAQEGLEGKRGFLLKTSDSSVYGSGANALSDPPKLVAFGVDPSVTMPMKISFLTSMWFA